MPSVLTASEIDHFIDRGYVRIDEAAPRDVADACRALAYESMPITDEPPWPGPVSRGLVDGPPFKKAATTPRLLEAIGQLLAGERWLPRPNLGVLVVRYPSEVDPGDAGWHIDGSFQGPDTEDLYSWYVNYRSKGRGLLMLCLLSDVGPDDAPTRILAGSHHALPCLLQPFGDAGIVGQFAPLGDLDQPVTLATGQAGDVYLCHPFLVHAASWPHRGTEPRVIAQPPIGLEGGLRIDVVENELSPVARAVANGLLA